MMMDLYGLCYLKGDLVAEKYLLESYFESLVLVSDNLLVLLKEGLRF
jgi:hypothetical protein